MPLRMSRRNLEIDIRDVISETIGRLSHRLGTEAAPSPVGCGWFVRYYYYH